MADNTSSGDRVRIAAGVTTDAQEVGGTSRALRCDSNGYLLVGAIAGGADVNLFAVGGKFPMAASLPNDGVSGQVPVGGTTAHDAAIGLEYPILIGAEATTGEATAVANGDMARLATTLNRRLRVNVVGTVDEVLALRADGDRVDLLQDLYGRLYTRTAGYDSLTDTVKGTVNTIADDRDEAAQLLADETNTGVGTTNYPSDDGIEIGNRDHLTVQLVMTDNTTVVEASMDRVTWIDITPSVLDLETGLTGAASFATGAGAADNFMIDLERINCRYVRFGVTYPDATNATEIQAMQRKA